MAETEESRESDRAILEQESATTCFPTPIPIAYYGTRQSLQPIDEKLDPDGTKYFRSIKLHDLPASVPSLRSLLVHQKNWHSDRDSLQLNDDEESILLKYWGPSLETIRVAGVPDDFPLVIWMIDRHFLPRPYKTYFTVTGAY
jgi:hypothetical protein